LIRIEDWEKIQVKISNKDTCDVCCTCNSKHPIIHLHIPREKTIHLEICARCFKQFSELARMINLTEFAAIDKYITSLTEGIKIGGDD
jgi:hypothetical protein